MMITKEQFEDYEAVRESGTDSDACHECGGRGCIIPENHYQSAKYVISYL